MVLVGVGGVAVGDHDGFEVPHHGVARGRLAAHIGDGAGDQERVEPAGAQHLFDIRRTLDEGAVAVLLDDQVLRLDLEVGKQLIALAAGESELGALRAPFGRTIP